MFRVLILAATAALTVCGAEAQEASSALPLFRDDVPLDLRIDGPFRDLRRDGIRRPERPARLRYRDANGSETVFDVDIRVRGNSRLEICSFPPLRLDFKRGELAGTVFAGQNHLKLVTLCREASAYRDYLEQEYQIYKIFNVLTEASFRVRWARIEYVESGARHAGDSFSAPGFLIEEDWEVARRLGLEVIETDRLGLDELDRRHTALLSVFQFVIGNTDWAATDGPPGDTCCHNGKVIGSPAAGAIVLPYDFDQAGLIDASYARPNDPLPIRTVRQRLYRGYCPMNAELDWAIGRFNEERPEIEGILRSGSVSERARDDALAYLAESYSIIDDPEQRQSQLVDRCRGPQPSD